MADKETYGGAAPRPGGVYVLESTTDQHCPRCNNQSMQLMHPSYAEAPLHATAARALTGEGLPNLKKGEHSFLCQQCGYAEPATEADKRRILKSEEARIHSD